MAFDDDDEVFDATEEASDLRLTGASFSSLLVAPSDWTIETLYNQIGRQIDLDPDFQRRNVWSRSSKSLFIESLFLGIPIPQILLSSKPSSKNSYIVLDGKQRLLTIKEFLDGRFENGIPFKLTGLRVLKELEGKSWPQIQIDTDWKFQILNETQRTTVLRGWEDERVLYEVFYRLNSGSYKLSPMELRMSLHPGEFLKFVIKWTEEIGPVHNLLNRKSTDPRMKDVDLIVRYLAFSDFDESYKGDLKSHLDNMCVEYNHRWTSEPHFESYIRRQMDVFNSSIEAGLRVFERRRFCKKFVDGEYETSFNRALFDILMRAFSNLDFRQWAIQNSERTKSLYEGMFDDRDFLRSVESTTKSTSATRIRFKKWIDAIAAASSIEIDMPPVQNEITD